MRVLEQNKASILGKDVMWLARSDFLKQNQSVLYLCKKGMVATPALSPKTQFAEIGCVGNRVSLDIPFSRTAFRHALSVNSLLHERITEKAEICNEV